MCALVNNVQLKFACITSMAWYYIIIILKLGSAVEREVA